MNKFVCITAILLPSASGIGTLPPTENQPKFFEDTLQPIYGEVIFSSIIFRHGDRSAVYSYPRDPYASYLWYTGRGQLVKAGKQRAYRLGLWARARYANLIQAWQHVPGFLKVASSDCERTINSAQLFLAGFYPPKFDQELWNENLLWQPIAVHQIPPYEDNLIGLAANCPRYNVEISHLMKESSDMKKFYETYNAKFLKHIERNTGMEIPRNDAVLAIVQLSALYDTLFVQDKLGFRRLNWTILVYPQPLRSIRKIKYRILAYNSAMKRLKAGPLLQHIIRSMVKKRDNFYSKKVFQVYSGHESTLAVLLSSLGVYNGNPPSYSAAVFIELRYKDGAFLVTVIYRNSERRPPLLLELPNCSNPCTLDAFIEATAALIPDDWKKECKSFQHDYNRIMAQGQTVSDDE